MKIGFIESLKHIGEKTAKFDLKKSLRYVGKRTTVIDSQASQDQQESIQKRQNNFDNFNNFTKSILPQLEEKIEIDLLQKQFQTIQNEQLKNDLIQSYIKRRVKLLSIDAKQIEQLEQQHTPIAETHHEFINTLSQYPLNKLGEQDIGDYVQYPLKDIEQYFKDGVMFGDYLDGELSFTKKFSVMANEESLKFVEYLKMIKETLNKKIVPSQLLGSAKNDPKEIEFILKENEEVYFDLVRLFSLELLEAIQPHRSDQMFERYFATPNIFDFLVRLVIEQIPKNPEVLLNDLSDPEARKTIFKAITSQILEKGDKEQCNSQYLVEFMKTIKEIEIPLSNNESMKINLLDEKQLKNKRKIPQGLKYFDKFAGINSGAMLHGDRGTGKSGTLLYVTMWAHKNNFLVLNVPSSWKLTQTETVYFRHQKTGLYLQNEFAKEWLEYFYNANSALLENIPVNMERYGKIGYSGLHDDDPEAVPNVFYKRRKAYFEDHKQFLFEEEIKMTDEMEKKMEIRVKDNLESPKNLGELVKYGIENEWFACNVAAELMEQIYNLESHCVLVVVDEYNYLYKKSIYPSFRYANDKALDGTVPPYHLAFCRLFVNMDGHKIKNGFKLTASSVKRMQRHKFTPEKINFPIGYSVQMNGLPLDDFRKMCIYYLHNGLWQTDDEGASSIDYLWMQTQGNWQQAQKYMTEHYVDAYLLR